MKKQIGLITLLACLFTTSVTADEFQQRIADDPYFQSLFSIGLEEDQIKPFMTLVRAYGADFTKASQKVLRKNISGNEKKRMLKRAKRKLDAAFVSDATAMLNEQQLERFQIFHAQLQERARTGGLSHDSTIHSDELMPGHLGH